MKHIGAHEPCGLGLKCGVLWLELTLAAASRVMTYRTTKDSACVCDMVQPVIQSCLSLTVQATCKHDNAEAYVCSAKCDTAGLGAFCSLPVRCVSSSPPAVTVLARALSSASPVSLYGRAEPRMLCKHFCNSTFTSVPAGAFVLKLTYRTRKSLYDKLKDSMRYVYLRPHAVYWPELH